MAGVVNGIYVSTHLVVHREYSPKAKWYGNRLKYFAAAVAEQLLETLLGKIFAEYTKHCVNIGFAHLLSMSTDSEPNNESIRC